MVVVIVVDITSCLELSHWHSMVVSWALLLLCVVSKFIVIVELNYLLL